ncbi:MAG: hypothetical protein ABH865_07860 [Candidatus Omnitrophota bacterium]
MNRTERIARAIGYLRGEIEFVRKERGFTHSVIFISERMHIMKKLVPLLIEDSRMTLTEMSKRTGIPVSTVYDNLPRVQEAFKFTIVPKSIYCDEEQAQFEAGQTRMYDFKPGLKAS